MPSVRTGCSGEIPGVTEGRIREVASSSPETASDPQNPEPAIDLVREGFERVFEGGEVDAVDELYAPDCVVHTPDRAFHGPEGYAAYVSDASDAFSDFDLTIDDFLGLDDAVAARHTWRATHTGELRGIPPAEEGGCLGDALRSREGRQDSRVLGARRLARDAPADRGASGRSGGLIGTVVVLTGEQPAGVGAHR